MPTGTILLADDEAPIRDSLAEALTEEGHHVTAVGDGAEAIAALQDGNFDIVLTDLRMPGADGLEVLQRTREILPQAHVLLITAFASVETAVEALRRGAHDYILKPLIVDEVLAKIARLLEFRQAAWEGQMLRRELDSRFDFDRMIVGRNRAMHEVVELLRKVAPTNSTVLITGDSGTGKEVVARAIHHFSNVRDKLFLPVNCCAIPENLLEAQLFGHARGAFTGAMTAQEGLFQRARGGTIFLDEIGEMPLALQAKLLRAIEEKEILPLGTTTPVKVDVRILAATNRNLKDGVAQGMFREDLYYRLNVIEIELPPLRERREDIPDLIDYLVRRHNAELNKRFRGVDNSTMKLLLSSPWKGNIRELDNVIEHAMIVGEGEWITTSDLPRSLARDLPAGETPFVGDDLREALRAFEKAHIEDVLERARGDKRATADLLGVSLSSLYRKIDELGIGTTPASAGDS